MGGQSKGQINVSPTVLMVVHSNPRETSSLATSDELCSISNRQANRYSDIYFHRQCLIPLVRLVWRVSQARTYRIWFVIRHGNYIPKFQGELYFPEQKPDSSSVRPPTGPMSKPLPLEYPGLYNFPIRVSRKQEKPPQMRGLFIHAGPCYERLPHITPD